MSTASTSVAKQSSQTASLAQKLGMDEERLEFISKKYCAGAPPLEIENFVRFAAAQGLDISAKHAYLIPRKDSNTEGGKSYTIQIGIDGYRTIAEGTGEYDGQDAPVFEFDAKGRVVSATVTVYRKGMTRGVSSTAFLAEYDGGNTMWNKMPRGQLAKCAEALALRKAFPKRLGGTYTPDEMHQASREANATHQEALAVDHPAQVALSPSADEAERKVLIPNIYSLLGVTFKGRTKDDPVHGETIDRVAAALKLENAINWSDISTENLRSYVANFSAGEYDEEEVA